jgi:hypothetical protein
MGVKNGQKMDFIRWKPGVKRKSHESIYCREGLSGHKLPILPDGSLLLILQNMVGDCTGAQIIRPDGTKKLIAGSRKKGAFIPLKPLPARASYWPNITARLRYMPRVKRFITMMASAGASCPMACCDASW